MMENVLAWFLTGLKFLLCIHYFACGWVMIYLIKELEDTTRLEFAETSVAARYFESFYLITTTITTVGYGDYKAFNSTEPVWFSEMLYLYWVSLIGTLLFSSVTNSVFSYQKLHTVNHIVKETLTDMEEYLFNVSKVRPEEFIG